VEAHSSVTRRGTRVSRALDIIGRVLVASGLLLGLFVVYQLWGTGLRESREQAALSEQLETVLSSPSSSVTPTRGAPVSRIAIPSLGVDKVLVGGVDAESLMKGPGLFPNSPLPGQLGNVAVAGHRTTYGAPFEDLDKITVGDTITFATPRGTAEYRVTKEPYNVFPSAVEVVETKDPTKATLTLVTCTPKWTAWKRLIVEAELVTKGQVEQGQLQQGQLEQGQTTVASPEPATPFVDDELVAFDEGWFHDTSVIPAVAAFGALLVAIWTAGWWIARRTGRKLLVWPPTGAVFLMVLFFFFENLTGLLPTNL
jgi:sortase A